MFSFAELDQHKVATSYLSVYAGKIVDRVAIVRRKDYRDAVDFLIHSWTVFLVAVEYFQEESPCM
jgi:hypothetical protein